MTYPRPDFVRSPLCWQSLDRTWNFAFDDSDAGLAQEWCENGLSSEVAQQIQVPFVYQTAASGINQQEAHGVVWYQTEIRAIPYHNDEQFRTILHFGAVDYEVRVFLDGHLIGTHCGGHTPFEFDLTGRLDEDQASILTVRVWDAPSDLSQPRGKQYWGPKPEGIFYTPSTGIWQSVWLENVPPERIGDSSHGTVLRSNDITSGMLDAEIAVRDRQKGQDAWITLSAALDGQSIADSGAVEINHETDIGLIKLGLRLTKEQQNQLGDDFKARFSEDRCWLNGLALWSPECPFLYDVVIRLWRDQDCSTLLDEVKTTVGMRSISWRHDDGTLRLNGKPYFHALVLDQGYWPETNMTPPDSEACKRDILLAKAMGFNGCRKHQKVESPDFLYWADRLGFMVWGEMANGYEFSRQYVQRFDREWCEAVQRDINHPSVVVWTPINETWGYGDLANSETQQTHLRSLYYQTKTIDPTRPINDNCGWEHVCTDLTTFHDYADGPQLADTCRELKGILGDKAGRAMFVGGAEHKKGMPILCTEFGGVNIALQDGDSGVDGEWGYTTAKDSTDLLDRVRKLMLGVVEGGHCCGFVYTQL